MNNLKGSINSTFFGLVVFGSFLFGCATEAPDHEKPKKEEAELILEYSSTKYLIEPEELATKLEKANVKLIDMRDPNDYSTGHIQGAINIWRPQITDTTFEYGGMMGTKEQLEKLLGNSGILPSDSIIIYDDRAQCNAARLWWLLKYFGHEHMAMLNGGLKSWEQAGGILSKEIIVADSVKYTFSASSLESICASQENVKTSFIDTNSILLDTRGPDEFSGEKHKDGAADAGAIPNAINMDWSMAVDYHGDQKFLPYKELKRIYAEIGIDGTQPVITYCHSGVRSAHTLFVLTELLGYKNVRNYDGSWIEWSYLENKKAQATGNSSIGSY